MLWKSFDAMVDDPANSLIPHKSPPAEDWGIARGMGVGVSRAEAKGVQMELK